MARLRSYVCLGMGNMATFFFFLKVLLLSIVFLIHPRPATCYVTCSTFCSKDGRDIRFPFRLKNQPKHCSYPGFEIECKGKEAVIDLPPAGQVVVFSIFYGSQTMFINPPRKCAAAFFIDFESDSNATSPFRLSSNSATTTNSICSKQFHIYAAPSYVNLAALPGFCTRGMALPVESYEEDGVIGLAWNVPGCGVIRISSQPFLSLLRLSNQAALIRCVFQPFSPLQAAIAPDSVFSGAAGLFVLLSTTLLGLVIYWGQSKPNSNEDISIHLKAEFLENFQIHKAHEILLC
ncbi:hypothetical protein ACLOJK_008759 [Asimina triloba]